MMGEMEHQGMPCPNPDAAPLWAWARWVDSKGRAHTRPDRRYPGFRNQYDGLELLHLRVDESRVLCTDFDQYHCVINNWPCAPLDAGAWPPAEYNRWLDEHWDDPPEKKRLQYRENVIVDPKTAARPVDPGMRVDDHARRRGRNPCRMREKTGYDGVPWMI